MTSFHEFLQQRITAGGFSTEDVLASFVPLMQQVITTHEADRVAPLDGLSALHVENEAVWYARSDETSAQIHLRKVRVYGDLLITQIMLAQFFIWSEPQ